MLYDTNISEGSAASILRMKFTTSLTTRRHNAEDRDLKITVDLFSKLCKTNVNVPGVLHNSGLSPAIEESCFRIPV
jgi:hypothetical protein